MDYIRNNYDMICVCNVNINVCSVVIKLFNIEKHFKSMNTQIKFNTLETELYLRETECIEPKTTAITQIRIKLRKKIH